MNRDDFPMLKKNLIYFDNGATTLKPKVVVDAIKDYYESYTANVHRGDYDNSIRVDEVYESVRDKVKLLINANSSDEIIFTKGSTDSLNMIVFGFMRYELHKDDEVILTKTEHASNVLPWMELSKEIGFKIKYVPLDNLNVTLENIKKTVTDKTKVISIAHISNVIGDIRPIKEISEYVRDKGIYFVVDGAQSVPHIKIDVKDLNIDFLVFSAHKMLGPTGVGFLYGKYDLLNKVTPMQYGGGMNDNFSSNNSVAYAALPSRLEAGTPNISGVIGLGQAISYLLNIRQDNIYKYEHNLRTHLVEQLNTISGVTIYNEKSDSGIVIFNIGDIGAGDVSTYLNKYNICVRSGNHCTKMLKEELQVDSTCRISLYFYNTKKEIDFLIKKLKSINYDDFKYN